MEHNNIEPTFENFAAVEAHINSLHLANGIRDEKQTMIANILSYARQEFADYENENEQVRIWLKNSLLNMLLEVSGKISKFGNKEFLLDMNYILSTCLLHPLYCLKSVFECYDELVKFKKSRIDETQYYREKKSIVKRAKELQRYSRQTIVLDDIPDHPADILKNCAENLKYTAFYYSDVEADKVYDDTETDLNNKYKSITIVILHTLSKHTIHKNIQRLPKETKQQKLRKQQENNLLLLAKHLIDKATSKISDSEAKQIENYLIEESILLEPLNLRQAEFISTLNTR